MGEAKRHSQGLKRGMVQGHAMRSICVTSWPNAPPKHPTCSLAGLNSDLRASRVIRLGIPAVLGASFAATCKRVVGEDSARP